MSQELKSPNHYTWRMRECYKIQQDLISGSFGWTAYAIANIVKYLYRYPMKGGVDDLLKAQRYLKLLIEHEYPMEVKSDADLQVDMQGVWGGAGDPGLFDSSPRPPAPEMSGVQSPDGESRNPVLGAIQRPGVDTQVSLPQESRDYIKEKVREVDELRRERK